MEEFLGRLKEYITENPLGFTKEQKEKLVLDAVGPRKGTVCDEYVEFRLWMKGLKSRQEYFAEYVEQKLPVKTYPRLLEVGCGRTARLSRLLCAKGYKMTAIDSQLEPEPENLEKPEEKIVRRKDAVEGLECRKEAFDFQKADLSRFDAVIGQEPCEATEHIIRACLAAGLPFVISLCGTPHRLINGEEPADVYSWYAYLEELGGEGCSVKRTELIPGFVCYVMEGNPENR